MNSPLALVVAMTSDRVIGLDGDMPWHIPEDLRHFRRVTMGHAIIMGRKTHESIGRALPGRQNIVVTRQPDLQLDGCDVVHGLNEAIALARQSGDDELALPLATKLIVTEVDQSVRGDTFFPRYNPDRWKETHRKAGDGVVYRTLELK